MSSLARRSLVLTAVLLPVTGFALWLSFSDARATTPSNLGAAVPLEMGDWQGEEKPLSERVYQLLETRDVVFRRYERAGDDVWLCLVQAQDNRRGSHPPEICYQGQGYEVDSKQRVDLLTGLGDEPRFATNRLQIHRGNSHWAVLYWYQVGSWQTASYAMQQLRLLGNLLLGRAAPAIVVRFDTPIEDVESTEQAFERLERFARAALPHLRESLKSPR